MLTDGKAKDVVLLGELEAIATRVRRWMFERDKWAYMAVLWERTVFSPSSNSWN